MPLGEGAGAGAGAGPGDGPEVSVSVAGDALHDGSVKHLYVNVVFDYPHSPHSVPSAEHLSSTHAVHFVPAL